MIHVARMQEAAVIDKTKKRLKSASMRESVQNGTDTENRSRYKHAQAGAPMVS